MRLAGPQAVRFCASPKPDIWAFLVFGDDEGVVMDNALALRTALAGKAPETEFITLDEDEVKKDPPVLFDALEARSLLGAKRIIRVRTTSEKASSLILEAVALGEADPQRFDAPLIITAGALAKRSKLRSTIESAKHAAALHLYADTSENMGNLVRQKLSESGIEIDADALALFTTDLPGHRGLANQEIEKLSLYGQNLDRPLNTTDIRSLSTTDIDHALTDLVRSTLKGENAEAAAGLDRLTIAGTSPISILRALQREAARLLQAHQLAGSGGDIGMKLRPPVFKSDWPAFRTLMSIWSPKRLSRTLERIYDAEATIKTAGPLGDALIRQLLLDLSRAAAAAKPTG
ncbi:MAG: DNA polymerase III subunit delta [Pseudomonadota bacterium]